MKKRSVFVFAILVLLAGKVFAQKYSGGTGEPNNPYRIETPNDLNDIGQHLEDWASFFILTADVDLSADTGTAFHIIGSLGTPFSGSFDGNGHTISNFTYTYTGTYYIGLFGYAGTGGEIKNLGMVDVNVNAGTGYYVGGLVGWNDGTVSNCYATGNVTGSSGSATVGGLVGWNYGTLSNCYATGTVSVMGWYVGGLVGKNHGTVTNCYATGTVSGVQYVGGLMGWNYGTVSNCYAAGNVTGLSQGPRLIGGLVGSNGGTVSYCYATGNVYGDYESVGGLVGFNYGTVSNCYATGGVTGRWDVGGLVGTNYSGTYSSGTVSNCYATGNVTGIHNYRDVGGLVGKNDPGADIFASFWDIDTSGQASSAGGTGKTTGEMQTKSTFTDAGWDFDNIWDIWEGETYPFLRIFGPPVGLRLLTPNGEETLIAGTTYAISWSSAGSISSVLIEYSTDNGSNWTPVDPPNTGNTGSYDWTVPMVDSNQCLVRISDANDANVSDISDSVFTIEIPGSIVSWGHDEYGQVSNTPTESGFTAIDGGTEQSLALKADGSIVAWGRDADGHVSNAPTESGFTAISGGHQHNLALRADGSIVAWGWNGYGQVSNTPTESGFIAIAARGHHSLALKADGSIVAWGKDAHGQVSNTPIESGFTAISGGYSHSLALRADGSIVSWGDNADGAVSNTPTDSGALPPSLAEAATALP